MAFSKFGDGDEAATSKPSLGLKKPQSKQQKKLALMKKSFVGGKGMVGGR